MVVEEVFAIQRRGVVATGRVESGVLRVGDEVTVNGTLALTVTGIEVFRKKLDEVAAGETVGVLFGAAQRSQLNPGDVLTAPSLA